MKKLILSAVLLLFASTCAWGQGGAVAFAGITNPQGQPVPGVQLHFCFVPAVVTSGVCSPSATVYKDQGLAQPWGSAIVTDGLGNFPVIWFTPGDYCYSVSGFPAQTNVCEPFSVAVGGLNPTFTNVTVTGSFFGGISSVFCLNGDTGLDRNAPAWWNMGNCTPGNQSGTLSLSLLFDDQNYIASGTAAAPSRAFKNDSATGSYLVSGGVYGITAAGAQVATFSSAGFSAGIINGIVKAEKQPGATLDVQLNNCITAAQAKAPHICDARNAGNGTIAAQVNVGDNATATPVTLWLPTAATWTSTIADGTSCAIMIHDKGNMIGDPAGQGIDMKIVNAATGNLDSLVCTDPAPIGGGTYGHIGGFLVQSALGGTVVTAALNIQKTFDNFLAERITANCQGCVGVYTHNLCCGLVMRGIQSDGSSVAGSKPCVIGNTGENTSSIHFADEFNCVHPGNGNAAMIVQGTTTWTQLISWDSIYLEPNQADTTTALASFTGSNGPFLIGQIRAGNFGVGPNNYLIDATSVQGLTVLQAIVPPSGNTINDHVHTVTITGTSNQTVGPYGWGNIGVQFWLTKLTVANNADVNLSNTINCGATATKTCTLDFLDQGTAKYSIQKDSSNNFVLFNSAAATSQLTYNAAGNATYNAPTGQSHAFEINSALVGRFNSTGLVLPATISSLNGVSTADYGIPAIQGTPQHLTGQVGNLGATNLYAAAPPAGVYRVCFDAFTTTSGTGTTMTVSIGWTDAGGAKTFTSATWALNSLTITGYVDGCKIINSSGAANITVSTTGTIGTSAYAIDAMAERMK